jgi:branched-subunit amino acid aminotransferase/4-amino-4-deoxychorismate lyase
MTEPITYLNGRLIPAAQAGLPLHDAGVVMGATVSELCRTFRHQPFRLTDHLDRLAFSLRLARIEPGISLSEIESITLDVVRHNAALLTANDELGVVIFVTPGLVPTYRRMTDAPRRPTVCVHTFPMDFTLYQELVTRGARLATPAIVQVPSASWDPRLKCRSRMHYYLADLEARRVHPDAIALLLDEEGHVRETNAANFLMVKNGTLFSPPAEVILPGISRMVTIEIARRAGIPFVEQTLSLRTALEADEVFLTSTPYCLAPVTHINDHLIGAGQSGPIFDVLRHAWDDVVGLDFAAQIVAGAI